MYTLMEEGAHMQHNTTAYMPGDTLNPDDMVLTDDMLTELEADEVFALNSILLREEDREQLRQQRREEQRREEHREQQRHEQQFQRIAPMLNGQVPLWTTTSSPPRTQ
jgi:hypothetical protein